MTPSHEDYLKLIFKSMQLEQSISRGLRKCTFTRTWTSMARVGGCSPLVLTLPECANALAPHSLKHTHTHTHSLCIEMLRKTYLMPTKVLNKNTHYIPTTRNDSLQKVNSLVILFITNISKAIYLLSMKINGFKTKERGSNNRTYNVV